MNEALAPGLAAQFDHAAVAGRSLREQIALYGDLLGGQFFVGGDNPRVGYRAVQLRYPNGARLELMEPLRGSTFFDRFFAAGGSRLHHLTFKVTDLDAAIAAMSAAGFTPTGVFRDSEEWKEVFFHPKEAGGVLVQLAQPAAGYPTRMDGFSMEDVLDGRAPGQNGEPSP